MQNFIYDLNFTELLWTAPEHIRQRSNGIGASQKGDVFSFGIILQEIAMRSGPYEGNNEDAEGELQVQSVRTMVHIRRYTMHSYPNALKLTN